MNRLQNAKVAFQKVTHVIFDMDGLLLDTEKIYKSCFTEIAKRHGKIYTDDIRIKVLGTVAPESARIAVHEMKLPITPEQFLKQFKDMANQTFRKYVPFMPGAERLVTHLHANKVPIAVATSSSLDSYNLKTQHHKDFFKLFNHTVTGGSDPDVKNGKPSPDIFLVCAKRFKNQPKPNQCLVFEDAPNGVTAAVKAGMQCVMIPDKHVSKEHCKHATIVLESLDNIKLELFGLPAFNT